MLQICRAEDGQVFQVNAGVRDIERIGSLELFLHQETGIEQDSVIAYLPDGRRLTNSNLRELTGSQNQSIFVFNKYYLDLNVEDVLRELRVEAQLQPPIEDGIAATPPFRPSQLAASYLRTARIHKEQISNLLASMHCQHEGLRVASTHVDMNVLNVVDTFDGVASSSRRELEKQAVLLAGLEADLDIISRVRIHTEFVSPAVRRAIEAGEKPRTLGDYVSNIKMRQVADTCARTHEDLRTRFIQCEKAVSQLQEGTDSVRATIMATTLLDDAEASSRRSQELLDKTSHGAGILEGHVPDPDTVLQELRQCDFALRQELQYATNVKNAYTQQCISTLRTISVLNNDMIQIPPALANLQASFRGKNSFSHIQRLHNMLYAYGATVIEIVRRKEFARFFYQRAQSILEVMAKLSTSERKRRQVHRGEVHGQLPFETRGMDDPVPTIDFSPSGNLDAAYSLEREDVDGLIHVLDDLDSAARVANDDVALAAVQECRASLEKLVLKMDSLESGFDRIAERSLLSASRLSETRRRSTEADEQAFQDLSQQLREAQEFRMQQDSMYQEERYAMQAQIHRLQGGLREAEATAVTERENAQVLERELEQARAHLESERSVRRIVEERNAHMGQDVTSQREDLAVALADATEQSRVAEGLRAELGQVRADFDEVKKLEERNASKVAALLEEQAENLRKLEEARARGENLEEQIKAARTESEKVDQALKDAGREKDRMLRAQASEHDRIIRDHIAEADGDRAVLERQFHELKAVQEHTERQLEGLRSEMELGNADSLGLREELQRVQRELRDARTAERVLREDLRAGRASQSDFEQRLEESGRLTAQILDVAMGFRAAHVKALNAAQLMTSHPGTGLRSNSAGMAESTFSSSMRHSIISHLDEPSPIDPTDPAAALEVLRAFDHDHFLEAITKTGSTIRKWQKQCKEYRERAKGKISFRNFAKGDLALFLPTRNSVSKPWAAFNVSFPHYFLQATGHLGEQLKTREWIVARITSITERLVDHNDPTSNPYGLGDGVKYYMLEVEDWTQPTQSNKRRVSSRKVSKDSPQSPLADSTPALPPGGPPEAEVEDSFLTTHSPNLHLFPSRARSGSSPPVRPSSLSRLLAQAPPESSPQPHLDPIPDVPATAPSPPTSPSHHTGSAPQHVPVLSSPLRPGSRASRISTTSRFSVGRGGIPVLGASTSSGSPGTGAKAPPTTALAEQQAINVLSSSPSSAEMNPFIRSPSTPSPDDSMAEGVSNVLRHSRRRTASYPRTSPLAAPSVSEATTSTPSTSTARPSSGVSASNALANLASSWGVSFGRKKKPELASLASTADRGPGEEEDGIERASELLKRF
ncbi:putative peripheral membrane protein [Roridomyces roridus]|uniref:Autophagy-related protein 11 n=1 Tax=Roridomyces roridus TaxID=1738132 RepID=A0AAD7BZZ6_9AGAR|nr:putative peripheral membrane protein [Roridomyces roridus]